WSLQGLGTITRTMIGRPDDYPLGFLSTPELLNYETIGYDDNNTENKSYPANYFLSGKGGSDYSYLHNIANNYLDGSQDVFYVNVGNISTKFYIGKDKSILTEEYLNAKITPRYNQLQINKRWHS